MSQQYYFATGCSYIAAIVHTVQNKLFSLSLVSTLYAEKSLLSQSFTSHDPVKQDSLLMQAAENQPKGSLIQSFYCTK